MGPIDSKSLKVIPTADDIGLRIDKFLGNIPEIKTRSRAEILIDSGSVTVNGKPIKSSYKVQDKDEIFVLLPQLEVSEGLKPLDLKLEILFEDSDIIVVNKPAGLVVHPSAGHENDTLVNALINHSGDFLMKFNEVRPGIVHRLDKDTSGILVVGKNDFAVEGLVLQFKARSVHRKYEALVHSTRLPPMGTITSYLARHPSDRKKFGSVRDQRNQIVRDEGKDIANAKWAVTHFKVLDKKPNGYSLVELRLETGRTHQIRIHLAELGFPVVADPIYGKGHSAPDDVPRLCLHAKELGFRHPRSNQELLFKQGWPSDINPILQKMGFL